MKINIGPYKDWIGPHQIADVVFFWSDKHKDNVYRDSFAQWLNNTWVRDFCVWIDKKRKRKMKVHIHNYDTWSAFVTLAHIIHPTLVKFRETIIGAPFVDDEDVPDLIKSTNAEPKENEWDTDSNHFKRWDYVLDEMIWAFYQYTIDWENVYQYNSNEDKLYRERIDNGLRLFAKYYRNLWD